MPSNDERTALEAELARKENHLKEAAPQPRRDPWAHRTAQMSCATCMWYVPKRAASPGSALGRCRRHAPTMGGYPVVFPADWCGDHKLDEEKA